MNVVWLAVHMAMEVPMDEWDKFLDENAVRAVYMDQLSNMAAELAVKYAQISTYAGERGGYGLGDNGHFDGLKSARKMGKKVRKALS